MFTTSYSVLILSQFVIGAMATVRVQIGVLYLSESLTKADYQVVYTTIAILEGFIGIVCVLYFMFFSKDTYWLMMSAFFLFTVGSLLYLFVHEAPRYLLKSGQID
jgi:membrane protein YdbS with pleckstrin-like domain